jgi:alcohol dehydrogenase
MPKMKAALFIEPGRIVLDDKPVPEIGPNDALMRITTTTICGTDMHILKGEYPVEPGLTIGHEPVGVIEKLGSQRRWLFRRASASSPGPSAQRPPMPASCGLHSQDGPGTPMV